eukprot:scaffold5144_cov105-Isochrysis_galbana.AAC.3
MMQVRANALAARGSECRGRGSVSLGARPGCGLHGLWAAPPGLAACRASESEARGGWAPPLDAQATASIPLLF